LTSALLGGEWSVSHPGRFNPGEKAPGTHWVGRPVDPRTDLDDVEKKNFLPYRHMNFDLSVVQTVASRYIDYATPARTVAYWEVTFDINLSPNFENVLASIT
jgi:hypothetical protein